MRQKKDKRLALSAAADVLNRNNLTGKQRVEVSGAVDVSEGWAAILRERRAARAKREAGAETKEVL